MPALFSTSFGLVEVTLEVKLLNIGIQRWEEQCHFDFMFFLINDLPKFSQQIVLQAIAKNVLMLIAT